jgi:hypothetical protein
MLAKIVFIDNESIFGYYFVTDENNRKSSSSGGQIVRKIRVASENIIDLPCMVIYNK